MADYKESQISGKKYRRCNSIRINNHIAPHTPSVYFDEQDVVYVEDEDPIVMPGGMFGTQFNPANVIEILNTETLEPTGATIHEGELYVILFSKYIAAAKERDNQLQATQS